MTAEIAHHWLHAGDRPRALGACAPRRPRRPERAYARAEAADHLTRALELLERGPTRASAPASEGAEILPRASGGAPAWKRLVPNRPSRARLRCPGGGRRAS